MPEHPLTLLGHHPIVGHRGAAGLAPENTLPSFDLALDQGATALELDVHLSADGVPVVHHDATLDRTTDGRGPLADRTSTELAAVDAGARFSSDAAGLPFRGRGIGIPTLAEVLERYPSTPLLIELKVAAAAQPVANLIRQTDAFERCLVASFLDGALPIFRQPPFLAGASRHGIVQLWLRSVLGVPVAVDWFAAYAVPARYKDWVPVPTRRFIAEARKRGSPVHVWTVDEPDLAARLWEHGAAGIISNFPGRMVEARERLGIRDTK
ncbi:MAG: glycerophosphodiester phosphodiesterase family protein [Gemmatimonadota bacterium]